MPFWKAGKNDDQVLDELKETQKQNADEFVKKQEHADEAQKSSLIIDNNFTPVEYDPQYILQVNHLKKYFPIKGGMVSKTVGYVKAVDGVTFNLKRGTTMGLVGESGCGKTTTGRTILRLYDSKSGGQVLFNGQEVYDLSHKELRALRTKMQIIFQDPFSSLSPRMPVGEIIGEAVREHGLVSKEEFDDYIDKVMDNCGLQPFHKDRYPHEFSGGQRQRICIARALALNPEFIVCDEPVSALDVSIQAQIINLLLDLKEQQNLTYMFITHDLSVVKYISDRVGVMVRGADGEYHTITGNQMGVLLLDYIITARRRKGTLPENAAAISTIVTSKMVRRICDVNDIHFDETFTGFKFMAEKMNELEGAGKNTVIFSYEESYGYMIGHYVRDKDAVTASLLLTEMAVWYYSQGMTLFDALNALFEKYGWYGEKTHNLVMPGLDGAEKMANLMKLLRETPPSEIAGVKVATYKDYSDGTARDAASGEVTKIALSGSNVLRFELCDGTHIVVRPSGTEPKIKVYILTKGADAQERDANLAKYSAWVNTLA